VGVQRNRQKAWSENHDAIQYKAGAVGHGLFSVDSAAKSRCTREEGGVAHQPRSPSSAGSFEQRFLTVIRRQDRDRTGYKKRSKIVSLFAEQVLLDGFERKLKGHGTGELTCNCVALNASVDPEGDVAREA
jgi:hypothetical protein